MLNNNSYKVVDNKYINAGGHCMVLVTTVYDKQQLKTVYVLTSDGYVVMTSLDYVSNELDWPEDENDYVLASHELPVYENECPSDDDFELYNYCHQQYTVHCCKEFGHHLFVEYGKLPSALQQRVSPAYKKWLEENSQLVETDGEQIFINDYYTPPAEEHEQYIKDCKELLSYMEAEFEKTDVENPDDAWEQFYKLPATIGFGGRQVVLENQASVYTALTEALEYIISQE